MLRKRTSSHQKDQQMGHLAMFDSASESHFHRNNSISSSPALFVALNHKGLSDSDSVWSPTSPLDFRVFTNLGNPFRSPGSPGSGHQKSWDFGKVGLSIVDSIADESSLLGKFGDKVLRSSESKSILLGPQMRMKSPNLNARFNSFEAPKSLPKNLAIFPHAHNKSPLQKGSSNVVFEIGETELEPEPLGRIRSCSLDSCRSYFAATAGPVHVRCGTYSFENLASRVGSPPLIKGSQNLDKIFHGKWNSASMMPCSSNDLVESPSAIEIELSEDYTCVISHGPNPKTTHIYGDRVLEGHSDIVKGFIENEKETGLAQIAMSPRYPYNDFLSFCFSCNKKLEGKDVYIYRGEKAFCSLSCRSEEILIAEEMEKTTGNNSSALSSKADDEKLLETTMLLFT